ncbi:hypothetical protein H4S03_003327 [Coemansia sp. S3946]|nr:hypothetical protein H4S03_003327 [Coemansia sp. S3946]
MVLNTGQVLQGMALAYEATEFAARNKRVQVRAYRVLKYTLAGMVIANTLIYGLVIFPLFILRTANYGISILLRYDSAESTLALLSTRDAVNHFMSTLPLLGLDILVHARPSLFEDIFFGMLDEVDPEYSRVLQKWPRRKFHWARIQYTVQRLFKRYMMTLVASYLGRLPYVGWLVMPIGALTMMARFVGYPVSAAMALFIARHTARPPAYTHGAQWELVSKNKSK